MTKLSWEERIAVALERIADLLEMQQRPQRFTTFADPSIVATGIIPDYDYVHPFLAYSSSGDSSIRSASTEPEASTLAPNTGPPLPEPQVPDWMKPVPPGSAGDVT